MARKRSREIPVKQSSGNVFADLGFAEPEEELTKAQLAAHIREILRRRRLTQLAAIERCSLTHHNWPFTLSRPARRATKSKLSTRKSKPRQDSARITVQWCYTTSFRRSHARCA
jgi:predicted XRE-type DNA-binding protein